MVHTLMVYWRKALNEIAILYNMSTRARIYSASFLITFALLQQAIGESEPNYALDALADLLSEPQTRSREDLIDDLGYQGQLGSLLADLESQLLASKKAQEFYKSATTYGLPSFDNLRFRDNYIVSYDNSLKHPIWILECLKSTKVRRSKPISRMFLGFITDQSLPERFRVGDDDYKNSGYDRGHYSAACNNKANHDQLSQAYLYTNVAPQVPQLNRRTRPWSRLESYVVRLSRRSKTTYVITGSLYLPERTRINHNEKVRYRVIGQNRIAVPDFFYKVIVYESSAGFPSMEAFVLPNSEQLKGSEEISRYRINILRDLPKIQEFTGLRFFDLLPRTSTAMPTRFGYGYQELLPDDYEPVPQDQLSELFYNMHTQYQ